MVVYTRIYTSPEPPLLSFPSPYLRNTLGRGGRFSSPIRRDPPARAAHSSHPPGPRAGVPPDPGSGSARPFFWFLLPQRPDRPPNGWIILP